MTTLGDILRQIDSLRAYKAELRNDMANPRIMPSDVRELIEAIEEIDQDIKDLEKEFHSLRAQIWAKERR